MSGSSEKNSTLRVNEAVLKGVSAGNARMADAPISAQALLCLDILQTLETNVLWVAADVREMEKLHESIRTLQDRQGADDTVWLFQPLERIPPCLGNIYGLFSS
jgi:hypothetical protein